MIPTDAQKATAQELAKTHKADKIFVNSKGEFFTDYHYAHGSVNGKASEFVQVDIIRESSKDGEEQLEQEPAPTPLEIKNKESEATETDTTKEDSKNSKPAKGK